MLAHLIRKELLTQIISRRFALVAGLFALFVWGCLADGALYYLDQQREFASARRYMEFRIDQIANPEDRVYSWSEAFDMGYLVTKPPTPLSILVRGIEPEVGRSAVVRYSRPDDRLYRSRASESPLDGTLPLLDLGTVVQVVFSLLVLLLTYDAVSGEKEDGTLRLLASNPLKRASLLLGKLAAVALVVTFSFLIPFALGLAAVLLHPDIDFSQAELVRCALLAATMLVFLVVMACAGIAGSALAGRSSTSFVCLLAFWLAGAIVLPRLSLVTADAISPAPSVGATQTQKRIINDDLEEQRSEHTSVWLSEYVEREGKEPWGDPKGMAESYTHFLKEYVDLLEKRKLRWAAVDRSFQNKLDAWQNLATRLATLSPAFSFRRASVAFAGTGIERQRRFLGKVLELLETYSQWNLKDWAEFRIASYHGNRYRDGKVLWNSQNVPRFAYHETWPLSDLAAGVLPLAFMALWGVCFFAAAALAVVRYDVR